MAKISLSKNLKLKISSDFDSLSRYNLERIDTLAGTILPQSSGNVVVRSESNLTLEPNSSDLGGSGLGGSVFFGTADHPLETLEIHSEAISFKSSLAIKDTASGGSKSLTLAYKSDLAGLVDTAADRTLSFDLNGANRSLILGANLSLLGPGNLTLNTPASLNWTLPAGNGNSGEVLTSDGTGNITWEAATAASLDGLTDVVLTSPANGDALRYNSSTLKWENGKNYFIDSWANSQGTTRYCTHNLGTRNVIVHIQDENYQVVEVDSIEATTNSYVTLIASQAPTTAWTVLIYPLI